MKMIQQFSRIVVAMLVGNFLWGTVTTIHPQTAGWMPRPIYDTIFYAGALLFIIYIIKKVLQDD